MCIRDSLPEEAVGLFREWNIEMPHRFDESVAAERRKVTCQDHSFGGGARQRRNAFGKEVDVKQCVICAAKCEIPGTTKWWGVGQYSYMADLTTDHQPMRYEASRLRAKAGLAGVKWCDYCHVADHSSRTCPQYGTQQHVQAAKEDGATPLFTACDKGHNDCARL